MNQTSLQKDSRVFSFLIKILILLRGFLLILRENIEVILVLLFVGVVTLFSIIITIEKSIAIALLAAIPLISIIVMYLIQKVAK